MNKRFLLACLWGMMIACGVSAQSVLTPATKMLIAKQNIERQQMAKSMVTAKEKKMLTTILLEKDSNVSNEDLEAEGLEIQKRRGTVVFAYVPVSRLEALAEVKGIRMVDTGESVEMKNDLSREASSVVMVHNTKVKQSNTDEPLTYRGKGVDVGIIDFEFDLGHPAFLDANGKTRVKHATILLDKDADDGHGTHVAGIAAGSTDVLPDDDPAKKFYGMAPESNLILIEPTGATAADILHALSEIFDKADADKSPVVVNMSLGTNSARLDATDPFNVALKELYAQYDMHGKILCICAGNEGDEEWGMSSQMDCNVPIKDGNWTAQKKLGWLPNQYADPDATDDSEEQDGPGKTIFMSHNKLSFYSKDERAFGVNFIMIDIESEDTLAQTGILTPERIAELGDEGFYMENVSDRGVKYSLEIVPVSEITTANRYLLEAEVNGNSKEEFAIVAMLYTKEEGMHVDATIGLRSGFFFPGYSALSATITNHSSLNPWAVTDNVISVGSYDTRSTTLPPLKQLEIGGMSEFSSCLGPEYGNQRPDVVAPGAYIISAYHHRIKDQKNVTDKSTYNGIDYFWGEKKGTSMSTPAVTGIVALWLQADPTLTVDDVREIIKKTSDYDEFCKANPYKSGYGKINAKKGLDYILSTAGVKSIEMNGKNQPMKYVDKNGRVVIRKGDEVYNVVGARVN